MILSQRRRLLGAALALPFAGSAFAQLICGQLTARQTEGPFFKTNTPQRNSLLEKGDKNLLVISGRVVSAQCKPVTNALLDFWHADELGDYDNRVFATGVTSSRTRREASVSRPSCRRNIPAAHGTST